MTRFCTQITVGSKRPLLACISWPVSKHQVQGVNTRLSLCLSTQLCCLPVDCASSHLLKHVFLDIDLCFPLILASYSISMFGLIFFDEQRWGACNKMLLIY